MTDKLTPEKIQKIVWLEEEVKAGGVLVAELTDKCRDLKAQLAKSQVCPKCKGTKKVMSAKPDRTGCYYLVPCHTCQGKGMYSESGRGSDGFEKCPICDGEGRLLQYADGQREEMGCDYCQGTGNKLPDREKIRGITHKGCTYHTKPVCPIKNNHACSYCEKMTDKILALFNEEEIREQLWDSGWRSADEIGELLLTHGQAVEKQERERIIVWGDETCPHEGRWGAYAKKACAICFDEKLKQEVNNG